MYQWPRSLWDASIQACVAVGGGVAPHPLLPSHPHLCYEPEWTDDRSAARLRLESWDRHSFSAATGPLSTHCSLFPNCPRFWDRRTLTTHQVTHNILQ